MFLAVILIVLSIVLLLLSRPKWKAWRYWENRGFPTTKNNFLFGSISDTLMGRKNLAVNMKDLHFEFKNRNCKVGGIYFLNLPVLLVVDNMMAKHVLQTDFEYFSSRGIETGDKNDPLQDHMFNLDGEPWKTIRRKLSPTFTSGKIKNMFPMVENDVDHLCKVLRRECANGEHDFLFYEYLERCGIDVIGHIAFGIDCNCIEEGDDEFYQMSKRIFNPKVPAILKTLFKCGLSNPAVFVKLVTTDKEMCEFFIRIVKDTVEYRMLNKVQVKDFLQMLIDMVVDDITSLTIMEIIAQAFLFFVAGFETSARSVGFAMYNLAKNKDIQRKLRQELSKHLQQENGKYTYDMIMDNEYLDMVFKETLRKYPPVVTLNRQSTKDYKIPDTDLVIPKDTYVVLSSLGFHYDPDYFPDPEKFNPERFRKENADQIKQFTYIPFGEGPRFCIGKRFGYMQGKLEVAKLVMNFDISMSPNKPEPTGFTPITKTLLLSFDKEVYLNLKPLN